MIKTISFILVIFLCAALFSCDDKNEMQDLETNKSNQPETPDSIKRKIQEIIAEDSYQPNISVMQNAIKSMLESELGTMTEADRKFSFAHVELNNDKTPETLILFKGPYFCGTGGCTIYLLDKNYNKLSEFSVSSEPIQLSETISNGWKDLLISSGGKLHIMKNDGKKYPGNPSVEPEYSGDAKNNTKIDFSVEYTF